jgi:DNA mismatch repair protein MutL
VIQISIPASQIDVNIHPRKLEVKLADRNSVHGLLNHALKTALASRYVLPTLSGNPEQPRPQITINCPQHPQLDLEHARSIKYQEAEAQKVRVKTDRRAIGQLQQTYILVESPDGLEIIDQHIAHERILYEKLLKQVQEGQVAQQRFLLPVRVELPFESVSTLIEERETLMGVGIEIDDFGGGTLLIRSYPSLLVRNQVQYGFKELLEKLVDALEQGTTLKEVLFDHLVAELACGGAIKAGHRLSLDEQQELVDRLLTMDNPYTCPHGRPITFAISRHDLDKKFKRA